MAVLFDAQNFYRSARRAFFDDAVDPPWLGQFWPLAVAEMIVGRDDGRELCTVRIYTGRPDRTKDVRGHSANVRQSQAWTRSGVRVRPRMLRYPHDWPDSPPQEKGVDVAIATDLVSLALRGACDVAVVASEDSDLIPAIEEVQSQTRVRIEIVAWRGGQRWRPLAIPGRRVWCHWLPRDDYEHVRDDTNYAIKPA